jgi:hypothetical protein
MKPTVISTSEAERHLGDYVNRVRNRGKEVDLDPSEELILPAIVWAEALTGVRLADSPIRAAKRRARLEAIRGVTGVEPFTAETAEHDAWHITPWDTFRLWLPQNPIWPKVPR